MGYLALGSTTGAAPTGGLPAGLGVGGIFLAAAVVYVFGYGAVLGAFDGGRRERAVAVAAGVSLGLAYLVVVLFRSARVLAS